MKLRSIELALPEAPKAAAFLTDIWGLALAEVRGTTFYLRGSSALPYLISLEERETPFVRSTTFGCSEEELHLLSGRVTASGWPSTPAASSDPGGGHGVLVELPEGELFRFLAGTADHGPLSGDDLPVQLTHVVINSQDAEATATATEQVLGFRVSDRTKGMVFVRCNDSHHSTAFARAGFSSLNHIAFEMQDLDAVMRGIGRLRDHGLTPAWGPGRHGPGANVFAYFIAPFGAVVEFSTAVEKVPPDYRVGRPEDWTWPPGRIDQWGMSDKDVARLGAAERLFRFNREWSPAVPASPAT
jgi:2,3-dihydroxy-p-cumate/2,3-dihydroxybenzoate 3,4-dioxygenase